jgi:hypothetical protein
MDKQNKEPEPTGIPALLVGGRTLYVTCATLNTAAARRRGTNRPFAPSDLVA